MENRIKVFNETNHVHNVRMLMPNGNYSYRKLVGKRDGKKAFAVLTEDQFLDLWMTTRDFKGGFLSYDEKAISDEIKMSLGLPLDEEEAKTYEPEFVIYKDEDIEKLIKGHIGKFTKFVNEVSEMTPKQGDELKRRIFKIAESIEDLNRTKAEAIEDLTGKSFKVNSENDKENKESK